MSLSGRGRGGDELGQDGVDAFHHACVAAGGEKTAEQTAVLERALFRRSLA
jgi:hypothetical protein